MQYQDVRQLAPRLLQLQLWRRQGNSTVESKVQQCENDWMKMIAIKFLADEFRLDEWVGVWGVDAMYRRNACRTLKIK